MAQPITWETLNAKFEELKGTLLSSATAQSAFTAELKQRIPAITQSISELRTLITQLKQAADMTVNIQEQLQNSNVSNQALNTQLQENNSQIQELQNKIQATLQQVATNTARYGQNQDEVNNLIDALQQTVAGIVASIQPPNQSGGRKRASKKMKNKSKSKNKNKRKTIMKKTKKSYKKKGGWSYSKRRLRGGIVLL